MRDPYTAGHQQGVSGSLAPLQKRCIFLKKRSREFGLLRAVHDIGKICVPQRSLASPANYRKRNLVIIKEHPRTGYDILKGIDFPWPVARAVLQHHEKNEWLRISESAFG